LSTNINPFSVTSIPCHCGYLAENAGQPGSPIKFDADLREYHFEHSSPSGSVAKWIIHHCPMCGGVASQSLRHRLSVAVPEDEVRRLQTLIGSIKTVDDIERVLGKPDMEDSFVPPSEAVMIQPDTKEPEKGPIRVLTYVRLSGTADVQFMTFSNRKVEGTISPKSPESKA
jgi:hypothetical protein